jgi:hypothetical protein
VIRFAYKFGMIAIWAAGSLCFLMAARIIIMSEANPITLLTAAGLAICCYMTLFSFLWGAQPGHWVRAASILLFTALSALIYTAHSAYEVPLRLPSILMAGVALIALNLYFRPKFAVEYSRRGRCDYFDEYFPQ